VLPRKGSLKGTHARADREVAAHYQDPVRAHELARLYEAKTPLGEFYRDRMRRIVALLEGAEGDLLDAGCGTGQMVRFLRDFRTDRFTLTGLDRSASMIEEARHLLGDDPAVRLVVGRVEEMPFDDTSFDVVLAMGVLEYVEDIDQVLAEIARVMRPGGLTVVTMQNQWSPHRLWDRSVWSRVQAYRGDVRSPIVGRLGERQFRSRLTDAGLTALSVVYFGFNVLVPPFDSRFPVLTTQLQRRLEAIARGPFRRLGTDYIVLARRVGETDVAPTRTLPPAQDCRAAN